MAAALRKAVRKELLPQTYIEHVQRGCHRVLRSLEWEGEDLRADHVWIGTGVGDHKYYCGRPVSVNDLHGAGVFFIMCAERLEMQGSENY